MAGGKPFSFALILRLLQTIPNLSNLALVRTIFLHPDTADQPQFLHKPLNTLVVQEEIVVAKFCCNAAIAVSSLVFVINCCDFLFGRFIFICLLHLLRRTALAAAAAPFDEKTSGPSSR